MDARAVVARWTTWRLTAAIVLLAGLGAVAAASRARVLPLVVSSRSSAAAARLMRSFARSGRFARARLTHNSRALSRSAPAAWTTCCVTAVDYAERPDASRADARAAGGDARPCRRGHQPGQGRAARRRSAVWAWPRAAVGGADRGHRGFMVARVPCAQRASRRICSPARVTLEVTPGSTKVPAGKPVTITAHVSERRRRARADPHGRERRQESQSIRMEPVGDGRHVRRHDREPERVVRVFASAAGRRARRNTRSR